jgi:hypothetical protein
VIAALGVTLGADAERHGQVQVADGDAVLFVIATKSSRDAGDERVVECTAAAVPGFLELGQRHFMHPQASFQGAFLHQRRPGLADRAHGAIDRGGHLTG